MLIEQTAAKHPPLLEIAYRGCLDWSRDHCLQKCELVDSRDSTLTRPRAHADRRGADPCSERCPSAGHGRVTGASELAWPLFMLNAQSRSRALH